jgi:hypothetical protein
MVPLVDSTPLQALLAVQLAALVEVQVNTELWPRVMLAGLDEIVTVGNGGGGGGAALTVSVCVAVLLVPPAPLQTRV